MFVSEQTFQQFKKIIDRVLASPRSDFYRNKFRAAGFKFGDLAEPKDIFGVPFLTRKELASAHPADRLYSDPSKIAFLRYTSGTSGSPILFSFRGKPRYKIPGKRPLILASSADLNTLYASADRSADPPYFPQLIGHATSYEVTARLAERYGIDAIVSTPSRALVLAENLSSDAAAAVKYLFLASERFGKAEAGAIAAKFPNAKTDIRYGLSEANFIGYQCDELRKSLSVSYHASEDYLFEIAVDERSLPIEDGAEGEIVITELYESPHQLIRYRTGDSGRIVSQEKCGCGADFAFEVTGRINYDIIKAAGGVIRADEIERVISQLTEWFEPDFRGLVEFFNTSQDQRIVFTLHLISKTGTNVQPASSELMRQEIARRLFLTPNKTLADFLAEKRLSNFKITLVKDFPPEAKIQKLRARY